jgi:glycosyltransferase involved in cell wall biosynthesis
MKIFFMGDSPTVDTGFGVVSKNLLPRLKKMGYDIVAQGINEFGDNPRKMALYDFPIYPTSRGGPEQLYGFHTFWANVRKENPDMIFFLNDPWLIKTYLDVRPPDINPDIRYVGYYPTDAAPLKPEWIKTMNELDAQICYSKYAEHVITTSNKGVRPDNLYQIYHGVDTKSFYPVSQQYARHELGLSDEFFIVGMVARNQPRKRFDILMMAFSIFAKDKDNAKLYLHTSLQDVGFDIQDIARQLNISDKLILTEALTPNAGVSTHDLNLIYNSFDINALISLGDGFGLPVAESMATYCPQIVSGHSCLQELVEDHGGLTVKNAAWISNAGGMNTWGGVSDVDDLVKKLNILYNSPDKRLQLAQDGYDFITQDKFNWDNIALEFDKVFKKTYHILDVKSLRKEIA